MLGLRPELGPNSIKRVYLLDSNQIAFYWGDILEGLKAVPEYFDFYTPEWTFNEIQTGHLSVWALSDGAIRGIVMTRILVFPKKKVFDILALYGLDMLFFFKEMEDVFMRLAKTVGCDELRATTRPGVVRTLQRNGIKIREEARIIRLPVNVSGDQ